MAHFATLFGVMCQSVYGNGLGHRRRTLAACAKELTSIFFILYPSPFPSCLAFNLEMSKRNHHKRSLQRKEQSERDRMYHFAGQTVSVLSITTLFPWLTLLRHIHSIKDMNQKAKLSPSS